MIFCKSLLSILAISSLVSALPNGAPRCGIDETAIAAGHGRASDPSAGYSINVQKMGNSFQINLKNSAGRTDFKGILMYVVGQDPKGHIGAFQNLDTNSFKYQSDPCKNLGFLGSPQSTITHANPSSKSISTAFVWTPLPGDELKKGPFKIQAVVATSPIPWQRLADVPIDFTVMAPNVTKSMYPPAMTTTIAPAYSMTPARTVLKCTKKSTYATPSAYQAPSSAYKARGAY